MKHLAGRTLSAVVSLFPHHGVFKVGKGLQDPWVQPLTSHHLVKQTRALSAPSRDNPAVMLVGASFQKYFMWRKSENTVAIV